MPVRHLLQRAGHGAAVAGRRLLRRHHPRIGVGPELQRRVGEDRPQPGRRRPKGLGHRHLLGAQGRCRSPEGPPFGQEHVRQCWHQALRQHGLGFAGPLRSLRHSGSGEDLVRGHCSLEQVRKRGRWRALESIQRYTKTSTLTKFKAWAPGAARAAAAVITNNPRRTLLDTLRGGPRILSRRGWCMLSPPGVARARSRP